MSRHRDILYSYAEYTQENIILLLRKMITQFSFLVTTAFNTEYFLHNNIIFCI